MKTWLFKEKEVKLEKTILELHDEIRLNRQEAKVTITNVVLDPPSPAILHVGDEITVEFNYDIRKVDSITLGVDAFGPGPGITLTGKGRTKLNVRLTKYDVSMLPRSVDDNRLLEAIYFFYLEPEPGGFTKKTGEIVKGESLRVALKIPVSYKIKNK